MYTVPYQPQACLTPLDARHRRNRAHARVCRPWAARWLVRRLPVFKVLPHRSCHDISCLTYCIHIYSSLCIKYLDRARSHISRSWSLLDTQIALRDVPRLSQNPELESWQAHVNLRHRRRLWIQKQTLPRSYLPNHNVLERSYTFGGDGTIEPPNS